WRNSSAQAPSPPTPTDSLSQFSNAARDGRASHAQRASRRSTETVEISGAEIVHVRRVRQPYHQIGLRLISGRTVGIDDEEQFALQVAMLRLEQHRMIRREFVVSDRVRQVGVEALLRQGARMHLRIDAADVRERDVEEIRTRIEI